MDLGPPDRQPAGEGGVQLGQRAEVAAGQHVLAHDQHLSLDPTLAGRPMGRRHVDHEAVFSELDHERRAPRLRLFFGLAHELPVLRETKVNSRASTPAAFGLGELVFGSGQADLQSFRLAKPSFAFGLGNPGEQNCRGSRAG